MFPFLHQRENLNLGFSQVAWSENMEGVLVWVIQRNITNRVCMISYKELAHMVMEAQKSHSLQLASWRPRKDDGVRSSLSLSSNQRQEKTDVPA